MPWSKNFIWGITMLIYLLLELNHTLKNYIKPCVTTVNFIVYSSDLYPIQRNSTNQKLKNIVVMKIPMAELKHTQYLFHVNETIKKNSQTIKKKFFSLLLPMPRIFFFFTRIFFFFWRGGHISRGEDWLFIVHWT